MEKTTGTDVAEIYNSVDYDAVGYLRVNRSGIAALDEKEEIRGPVRK